MPLHYNLSKVFFLSERKPEVIQAMVITFVSESTEALRFIKKGIHKKDYSKVYQYTASIESTIDLFGLDNAHDNAQRILNWTENKGKKKEIKETFKEFKKYIKSAIKELNKDYNLNQTVT